MKSLARVIYAIYLWAELALFLLQDDTAGTAANVDEATPCAQVCMGIRSAMSETSAYALIGQSHQLSGHNYQHSTCPTQSSNKALQLRDELDKHPHPENPATEPAHASQGPQTRAPSGPGQGVNSRASTFQPPNGAAPRQAVSHAVPIVDPATERLCGEGGADQAGRGRGEGWKAEIRKDVGLACLLACFGVVYYEDVSHAVPVINPAAGQPIWTGS